MSTHTVAEGVHRIEHAYVNCYLVEGDDGGITLVDAGLPAVWPKLADALRSIGRQPQDISALILTHAHFDHVGVARKIVERLEIPVWAHEEERYLAAHPYRYAHENLRGVYPLRYPRSVQILAAMAGAGALKVRGVRGTRAMAPGSVLDVPGRPEVLFTPGHTYGHCALHLPERGVLLSGDALVTLDPYTAHTGPRIVAGAATADIDEALRSLDVLAGTGARTVLPGHGEPWLDGVESAVELAHAAGGA